LRLFDDVLADLAADRLVAEACAEGIPEPQPGGRLVALGLGKVAAEMAAGARAALGARLSRAVVAAPAGAPDRFAGDRNITLLRGGHPLPDEGSIAAGEALLAAAGELGPRDAALILISGGGSALAEAPLSGVSLADLRALNEALLRSGAPIEEMNRVRAPLSRIKGGGLSRRLFEAGVRRALALVLVDVPNGGVAAVSSGPAASPLGSAADALEVLRRRAVAAPVAVVAALERAEAAAPVEPAPPIPHLALCDLRAPALVAAELAERRGWRSLVVQPAPLTGAPEPASGRFAAWLGAQVEGPTLFCASGELELAVPPDAPPGGRAQHLALLMARELRGREATFLAAGTDGRDGPTAHAGAVVDGRTWEEAERRGLEPERALRERSATAVLERLDATMPARPTGAHAGEAYLLLRHA
jgi:hydroxypyruvate reductase